MAPLSPQIRAAGNKPGSFLPGYALKLVAHGSIGADAACDHQAGKPGFECPSAFDHQCINDGFLECLGNIRLVLSRLGG